MADQIVWRKSSFSDNGDCVEVAEVEDMVLVRNSNCPTAGTLWFSRCAFGAFVQVSSVGALDGYALGPADH